MVGRDEKAISPQAALLLRAHQRIGRDRGYREGLLSGFWWGIAACLVGQGILSLFWFR